MKNIHFGNGDITTLVLIKEDAIIKSELLKYYINPLETNGLDKNNIAVYGLLYEDSKVKAELGKAYLKMLLSKIIKLKTVENIIVADTSYFKWLNKKTKVTDCYGETFDGKFDGYENFKIVLVPNYKSLFYNPNNQELITEGLTAITGFKKPNIIHSAYYITDEQEAYHFLESLHRYDALTIDIETTGLHLGSKLISIAFAWDKHNGAAIYLNNIDIRVLRDFFEDYTGTMIFHNALFDCKHLIYNLFKSIQKGLNVFEYIEQYRQDLMIKPDGSEMTRAELKEKYNLSDPGKQITEVTTGVKKPSSDSTRDLLKISGIKFTDTFLKKQLAEGDYDPTAINFDTWFAYIRKSGIKMPGPAKTYEDTAQVGARLFGYLMSGATVKEEEMTAMRTAFYPMPGDSAVDVQRKREYRNAMVHIFISQLSPQMQKVINNEIQ